MPTLIRLLLMLLVLAGLVFAGMIALAVFVDPGERDITVRIPARELTPANQPLDLNDLPAPVNVAPRVESSASSSSSSAEPDENGITTLSQGTE